MAVIHAIVPAMLALVAPLQMPSGHGDGASSRPLSTPAAVVRLTMQAGLWSVPRADDSAHPVRQALQTVRRFLAVPLGPGVKLVPRGTGLGLRFVF